MDSGFKACGVLWPRPAAVNPSAGGPAPVPAPVPQERANADDEVAHEEPEERDADQRQQHHLGIIVEAEPLILTIGPLILAQDNAMRGRLTLISSVLTWRLLPLWA